MRAVPRAFAPRMTDLDTSPTAEATGFTRVPLSVLDLAVVSSGQTSADASPTRPGSPSAPNELGYRRFWVAEHHNMPTRRQHAPAGADRPPRRVAPNAIRVGSGGVMLPNHPPLVVAEQFAMLEALHPGRIDLGIGRAPGTDPATAAALRRTPDGLGAEDFPAPPRRPDGPARRPPPRPSGALGPLPRHAGGHVVAGGRPARVERLHRPARRRCSACRSPSPTTSTWAEPSRASASTAQLRAVAPCSTAPHDRDANVLVAATDDEAEYLSNPSRLAM